MSDIGFLDDLGRELDDATGRIIRAQRRTRHRALLAPAAVLAFAAALAVALWPGAGADPEREVAAPGAGAGLSELLSVLRRPETGADRGPAAQQGRELLGRLIEGGGTYRLLGRTPAGEGIVLGAGQVVRPNGGSDEGACLHYPFQRGSGGGCWTAEDIATARAYAIVGDTLVGLAPDGARAAEIFWADGEDASGPVEDNVFLVPLSSKEAVLSVVLRGEGEDDVVARHHIREADVPVVPVPEEALRQAEALAAAPDMVEPGPELHGNEMDAAAAVEVALDVPYPPGMPETMDWTATPEDIDDPASIDYRSEVQMVVENRARCAWQRYWLAAVFAGDDAVAADAGRVLATVPRWPSLRDDPERHRRIAGTASLRRPNVIPAEFAAGCDEDATRRPPARPGPR